MQDATAFFVAHTERGAVAEFRRHHAALFVHVVLTVQADKHKAGLHIDIVLKSLNLCEQEAAGKSERH